VSVPVPAGIKAKNLDIVIKKDHLKVGVKGQTPIIDVSRASFRLAGEWKQTQTKYFAVGREEWGMDHNLEGIVVLYWLIGCGLLSCFLCHGPLLKPDFRESSQRVSRLMTGR
jgi:hypothetical protein